MTNESPLFKITLLTVLFSVCCLSMYSQELMTNLTLKRSLQADKFIGIDEFQSIYYINDDILFKQSKNKLYSFSNPELGKLNTVTIQNPFKLILFYGDFNAVIILDNNLNELSQKIDFTQETLFNNVRFASGASQNNIWLYADDNKLHLYDYHHLSEQLQTQALTFYQEDFQPKSMVSTYKNVWILSQSGVIQFNEYGIYLNTFEQLDIDHIFPYQKGFIFYRENSFSYNDGERTIPMLLKHDLDIIGISVNNSFICLYDGRSVFQYELKSRDLP